MMFAIILYTSIFIGIGENFILYPPEGHTAYIGLTNTEIETGIGTGFIYTIRENNNHYKFKTNLFIRRYFRIKFLSLYPYLEFGIDFVYKNPKNSNDTLSYISLVIVNSFTTGIKYDFTKDKLWGIGGIKILSNATVYESSIITFNLGLIYKIGD